MTTVESSAHIMGKARRLPGALATLLAFLVVGPLAGGGTIFLAVLALNAIPPDFSHDLRDVFFFCCLMVAVPVAVVGALIAARQVMARPVAASLAGALGASVGVVWSLFLASEGTTGTLSVLAFVGATAATLICWWLTRSFTGSK